MRHQHGVFLLRVEVGRLHHPGVQLHAVGCADGEELLRGVGELGEAFAQLGVVLQGAQLLAALCLVQRGDGGRGGRGVTEHVVGVILTEGGCVRARELGEVRLDALGIDAADGAAEGTLVGGFKVDRVRGFVEADQACDVPVAARHLTLLHAGGGVLVDVCVAVALADVEEAVLIEPQGAHPFGVDVARVFVFQDELADAAGGVGEVHTEEALVTVEGHHGQLVGDGGELDAGNVAVGVEGYGDGLRVLRLDVVGVH